MKVKDLVIGCILLTVSCIFFIATLAFPTPPVQAAGPAFWPRVMSIILALFSLSLILVSLKKPINIENNALGNVKSAEIEEEKTNIKRPLIGILSTGLFILALYLFGFIFGTIAYFISITVLVSKKYTWKNLITAFVQAVVLAATIYFIFGKFLRINLPDGIVFQ